MARVHCISQLFYKDQPKPTLYCNFYPLTKLCKQASPLLIFLFFGMLNVFPFAMASMPFYNMEYLTDGPKHGSIRAKPIINNIINFKMISSDTDM